MEFLWTLSLKLMHGDVSNQWCRTYYSSKKHYITIKTFGSSLCKDKNCYKTDQICENREIHLKTNSKKNQHIYTICK